MKIKPHKILRVLSIIVSALLILCTMCAFSASAATVKLNKSSIKLAKGSSYTLKISGTSSTVKWSSGDKTIATVSSKGKVTGKKVGSTVISAKVGSATLKCTVKVAAVTISAAKSSVTVATGEKVPIKLTVIGSKKVNALIQNSASASISWGTWSGSTITLYVKGKAVGESVITVTSSADSTASCKIKVKIIKGNIEAAVEEEEPVSNSNDNYAEEILEYVNTARRNAGVSELVLDDKLCEAASIRAKELVEYYSHTRPDGRSCQTALDDCGCSSGYCGENIAAGYFNSFEVMDGWMNSQGHRKNILNVNYKKIGIGYCYDENTDYRYFWVQVFSD